MSTEQEQLLIEQLCNLLKDVMNLTSPPSLPDRFASIESVRTLYDDLISLRKILFAASRGDLSKNISLQGYLGGTLKTLQANMKHLTWQTKMIASGDFSQRVDFMGEFSDSFNAMVMQLDKTLQDLLNKTKQLGEANTRLRKEIAIRKKTEEDLLQSREELKRLAYIDSLTGLYNMRHFNQVALNEIDRTKRYPHPLSVMMFDIDHFKRINDSFGHSTGDSVLKKIAQISADIFRTTDTLARYGGEEFVVLFNETSAREAATVAERLRSGIEKARLETENGPVTITASFGISDCLDNTDTKPREEILNDFLSSADKALYLSKNTGRNRVTIFRPEIRASGVSHNMRKPSRNM